MQDLEGDLRECRYKPPRTFRVLFGSIWRTVALRKVGEACPLLRNATPVRTKLPKYMPTSYEHEDYIF
jgi:hypothetical protein